VAGWEQLVPGWELTWEQLVPGWKQTWEQLVPGPSLVTTPVAERCIGLYTSTAYRKKNVRRIYTSLAVNVLIKL